VGRKKPRNIPNAAHAMLRLGLPRSAAKPAGGASQASRNIRKIHPRSASGHFPGHFGTFLEFRIPGLLPVAQHFRAAAALGYAFIFLTKLHCIICSHALSMNF
jgi:hypothetical protein